MLKLTRRVEKRIDQLVPYLGYGDAASWHALWLRDVMRKWGYRSDIYAEIIDPRVRREGELLKRYRRGNDGQVILHYQSASAAADLACCLGKQIAMIYHNITPHEYFRPFAYRVAEQTRKAREALPRLADVTEIAICDSEFNRRELDELGFRCTAVVPIPLDVRRLAVEPDSRILRAFDDGQTNFLFVGRIAPNKKQEDILRVFAYYQKVIDSNCRLFLVGSANGTEVYLEWLKWLAERLALRDVYFAGHVSQEELVAYYKLADVFICMSEHEGFCVPLLESMYFQVPIVAYACEGVAETLGEAGVLVKAKEYDIIAEVLYVLVSDADLRRRVVEAQTKRLRYFSPEVVEERLLGYLSQLTWWAV